ncbi:MAG: M48 family metalloprotease [Hyphomicrobiaceae bacterium]|nr:M48 family metalloprotease [Hyphomicrobiaceae bacterium]
MRPCGSRGLSGLGALLGAFVLLSACQTIDGEPISIVSTPDPGPTATQAAEEAIGAREHPRIVAAFGGIYSHAPAERLLGRIVGQVISASEAPEQSYRVTILNTPVVNAFALPGGYIYVTRGLLALASDEAEMAAVIAHEMAHVTARHATERARQARTAAVVSRVMTDVLRDPAAGRAALALSEVELARFSRQQEIDADAVGIRTIARAGFDPYAALRFITALGRFSQLSRLPGAGGPDLLASHPSTPERVEQARRAARQIAAPGFGRSEREAYLEAIDGITFGDDTTEGVVRGRRFIHPRLGFTFEGAEGFRLENTPDAVLGAREEGEALRFDAVAVPPATSLDTYLQSGWVQGLDPASVERRQVNGLEAAMARAEASGWHFRIAVVGLNGTVYRFIFASRSGGEGFDAVVETTVSSFRALTARDRAGLRPLQVEIVEARSGDTVATLAARMRSGSDDEAALFMVLNGFDAATTITPGMEIKLIR